MSTPSSAASAQAVIARLDLEGFIRSWNTGLGSIITSYGAFLEAIAFKLDGLAAFDAAMEEAAADGCEALDNALRVLLEPLIIGSALTAVLTICDHWALDLVAAGPEIVAETGPFADAQDFIDWAVAEDEPPAELCGPNGEPILDEASIETLLRRALGSVMAEARTSGWIVSQAVV